MNLNHNYVLLCRLRPDLLQKPMQSLAVSQLQTRTLFDRFFGKKKTEEEPKVELPLDVPEEPRYSEEEIMQMRDVSRLPTRIKMHMRREEPPKLEFLNQMRKDKIRQFYAKWGRASGIKPGVMWPAKDELEYMKGYEKAFSPPFEKLMADLKERKRLEAKTIADREKEVIENLKKLPQLKKEFWQKYNKMHDDIKQEKIKKERLVQEVREFVGYDLDPKDPRFAEALLKKDEEKRKEMKAQKKQEKAKAALEMLQSLASEAMEREERDKKKKNDKSETKTSGEQKADKSGGQ